MFPSEFIRTSHTKEFYVDLPDQYWAKITRSLWIKEKKEESLEDFRALRNETNLDFE